MYLKALKGRKSNFGCLLKNMLPFKYVSDIDEAFHQKKKNYKFSQNLVKFKIIFPMEAYDFFSQKIGFAVTNHT